MKEILKIINSNKITLAYLNNLENASAKQVINGEYVLNFVALIEPLKTEFLYNTDNFIEYNNDYFRVINIDEEHNSDNMLKVYVSCEHISYDLIKQTKLTYTQTNRAAIYVMNDLLLNSGFTFAGTDVTTTESIDNPKETDIKSLLYQVAVIWQGELSYFQTTIELKQQLGSNRGVDFRFGKNLANLKRYIDFVENTVSYEVEVVQGAELQELGQYFLGDTIRVVDDALNIEIDIRIIELETDIITGLNSRVVLGQPIKDLSNSFSNVFNSVNIAKQIAQDANTNANNANDKVNQVVDEHGNLIASKLTGALNTAITKVQNSTGKVTFDDRGLIATNQPLESTSTKAMLMTSDGILIANAKNADGTWHWRTAVTADGISANEITTGTLTAINIDSVTITGSSVTSVGATNKTIIDGGKINIYDTSTGTDEILLSAESGHLIMKGYLQTGTEVGATFVDNTGIYFRNETGYGSEIKGGASLSLSADVGITLDAGMNISIKASTSISLNAITISTSGNFNPSSFKGRSCSWKGWSSLGNFDSVLVGGF